MQSSIFILSGMFHYDGETTLGAYTSYDKAVLAKYSYKTELAVDHINGRYDLADFDDYRIVELPIDGATETELRAACA